MGRLDRFKRLEAPRTDRAGEGGKQTEARFQAMERERVPGHAPPPPPPRASTQRVERQVSDPPLALDTRSTEEQQFIRCMTCEADNSRYAQICVQCGMDLLTDAQRDFNERFFQQRKAEAAQEQQAVAQLHHQQTQLTEEQARVQRQAFEQMVREAQDGSSAQPPGIRFINSLKDPIKQIALIAAFALLGLGAGLGLWRSRPDQLGLKVACSAVLGLEALLFTPPSWWLSRRRRRGWLFGDNDPDDWL